VSLTMSADSSTLPESSFDLTRRGALLAGVAGAGALTLAACSGAGHAGTPGATPTAAADSTLVALDSITIGQAVAANLPDGSHVLVARPTATTAACFSAVCTHEGCQVKPAGTQLHCPCHGSVYNAVTGAVISGPAPRPLPAVPVHVTAGNVLTGSA